MNKLSLCNILRAEMHTGGCGYGNKRLCCKSCEEKAVCLTVCTKAYEAETCKHEENEREANGTSKHK